MAHLDAKAIAAALGGFRCGVGFLARCPSHDDREPSLSLRDLSGKVLVHCFGGCPQEEVLEALQARRLCSGAEKPGNLKPLVRPSPSRWDTPESERVARALQHWGEAEDPRRTLAEQYLASRKLALDDDLCRPRPALPPEMSFGKDEARCSRPPPVPAGALP